MSLKTDKVQLEIVVKADATRTEISKLEKEANNLSRQLKKLPKDSQEFIEKSKQYSQVKNRIAELQKTIGITGMTMRELRNRQRELNMAMTNMDPRTKRYKELQQELFQVNNRMKQLRSGATETGFSLSKMANNFNKYAAMMGAFSLSLVGIIMQMRKATDAFSSFEKAVSNLSSLTGLTGDKLKWLEDQAKQLSTSVLDGNIKITKSAEEIVDAYTKVGSKMPELLTDQEALNEVTKQALILAEAGNIDLDVAVNSLTNTMNQFRLPANQAADVINLIAAGAKYGAADIDFVGSSIVRFGAAANAMNVSTTESVALIEALAKGGLDAEKAGTGLKTFLLKSGAQADEFNVQTSGLTQVIKNLTDANMSAAEMTEMFGLEAYVVAQTLVTNADVYEDLLTKIDGTSTATEMAAINTNNHAATMAQAKNAAKNLSIEIGEKLAPHLVYSTNVARKFLVLIMKLPQILREYKGLFIALGTAILAYNAAKLKSIWITALEMVGLRKKIAVNGVEQASELKLFLLKAQKYALGQKQIYLDNLTKASQMKLIAGNNLLAASLRRIVAIWNMNPWGIAIAGFGALAIGINFLISRHNKLDQALVETRTEIIKEQAAMGQLFERLKYVTEQQQDRTELIKQINEQYGDYLPFLLNEESSLNDIAKAQRIANDEIERGIYIKSKSAKESEILTKFADDAANYTENILKRLREGLGLLPEQANDVMKSITKMSKTGVYSLTDIHKALKQNNIEYETSSVSYRKNMSSIQNSMAHLAEAYKEKDAAMDNLDNTYNSLITSTGKLAGEMSELDKLEAQLQIEITAETPDKDTINYIKKQIETLKQKAKSESADISLIDGDNFIGTPDTAEAEKQIEAWVNKYQDAEITLHLAYLEDVAKHKKALEDKLINEETYIALTKQLRRDYQTKLGENYTEEERDDVRFQVPKSVASPDLKSDEIMRLHDETQKQLEEDKKNRQDRINTILEAEKYSYTEKLTALQNNLELEFITIEEYENAVTQLKIDHINQVAEQFEIINKEVIGKVYDMFATAQSAHFDREYTLSNQQYNQELSRINNLLNSKTITEEEYNEEKAKIDEERQQRENEIKKKQIETDAKMQKVSVAMESAQTAFKIGSIMATQIAAMNYPAAVLSGVQLGLVVADTAIQIAAIDAAKDRALSEFSSGFYPLVGESGRKYNLSSVNNKPKTGIGNRPTHYIAHEKGPEMIIDSPTLKNIQLNAPEIISSIMSMRVPERAEGQYPDSQTPQTNTTAPDMNVQYFNRMIQLLEQINQKADNVYSFKDLYDKLQTIEKKYEEINDNFVA